MLNGITTGVGAVVLGRFNGSEDETGTNSNEDTAPEGEGRDWDGYDWITTEVETESGVSKLYPMGVTGAIEYAVKGVEEPPPPPEKHWTAVPADGRWLVMNAFTYARDGTELPETFGDLTTESGTGESLSRLRSVLPGEARLLRPAPDTTMQWAGDDEISSLGRFIAVDVPADVSRVKTGFEVDGVSVRSVVSLPPQE
jgi:hypothetical protein